MILQKKIFYFYSATKMPLDYISKHFRGSLLLPVSPKFYLWHRRKILQKKNLKINAVQREKNIHLEEKS